MPKERDQQSDKRFSPKNLINEYLQAYLSPDDDLKDLKMSVVSASLIKIDKSMHATLNKYIQIDQIENQLEIFYANPESMQGEDFRLLSNALYKLKMKIFTKEEDYKRFKKIRNIRNEILERNN